MPNRKVAVCCESRVASKDIKTEQHLSKWPPFLSGHFCSDRTTYSQSGRLNTTTVSAAWVRLQANGLIFRCPRQGIIEIKRSAEVGPPAKVKRPSKPSPVPLWIAMPRV